MNSVKINKSYFYNNRPQKVEHNKLEKDDKNNKIKKSTASAAQSNNSSNITDDAVICYNFQKRIENTAHNHSRLDSLNNFVSEYKKIKKEIDSGTYGKDIKKYTELLNNAFKNTIKEISDNILNALNKKADKSHIIKMTASTLSSCQNQYNTATTITWILKAENKRISEEIEYYRRKKNHHAVIILSQLKDSYKHVIDNVSATAALIQSNINDYFEDKSDQPQISDMKQSNETNTL